jgi:hypothetical protein
MYQTRIAQFTLAFSCLIVQQIYNANSTLAEAPAVVEADAKMVENCKFLGTTTGYSLWGSRKNAVKDSFKKATKMGATHLILGEINTDSLGSQYTTAKAYLCDQTTGSETTPQSTQGINTSPETETVQSKQDIYKEASETAVLIRAKYSASGVIIEKERKTYNTVRLKGKNLALAP